MSEGSTDNERELQREIPQRGGPESLSVVIPCFNEQEVLEELYRRLSIVLRALKIRYEVVLVDDGSSDRTWMMMEELAAKDANVKVIKLSRNFGHQLALSCGLDQARGAAVLIIDADLQDPPELLPKMLEIWRNGIDVVYGQRTSRAGETKLKRLLAYGFYRIISRITGVSIPADTGDFRLMDRKALDALLLLQERHRFVRGMVSWIGFKQAPIKYERPARFAGETKYPIKKSLKLAFDAITSFSYAPLRIASYLGLALSGLSFLYIVVVIALKFLGVNFPGYTSLMASVLLLGGVQLIVLGIIGEYVGRIFEQGQRRPLYLIESMRGEPLIER